MLCSAEKSLLEGVSSLQRPRRMMSLNLVAGAMTFLVLVGFNASLARSEDTVH